MARIPPSLLYLTIYNPTLRPQGPVSDDDEDAEEQAHILFYTSRERAVSRDRMLRQVGLAKALINFSEMFSRPLESCNNVHSQTKRMVMVSPEPDFWIHVTVELAKTPRAATPKGKGTTKSKSKDKDKGKGKAAQAEPTVYDYHDSSVDDLALRGRILRGYELFKLKHGSFTSVLATLGQQALELQIERFFTPWVWSWDLENGQEFGEHLGIPLHPVHRALFPILDGFSVDLPHIPEVFIVSPPCLAPSTQYMAANHPTSLARHIMSLIPPPTNPTSVPLTASEITLKPNEDRANSERSEARPDSKGGGTFLGMPAMNINMSMPNMKVDVDVPKWMWPFGKSPPKDQGQKLKVADSGAPDRPDENEKEVEETTSKETDVTDDARSIRSHLTADVDTSSLIDAMESEHVHSVDGRPSHSTEPTVASTSPFPKLSAQDEPPAPSEPEASQTHLDAETPGNPPAEWHVQEDPSERPSSSANTSSTNLSQSTHLLEIPEFRRTDVYLSDHDEPLETTKRQVYYLTKGELTLALIEPDVPFDDLDALALRAAHLLDHAQRTIVDETMIGSPETPMPSATKILQAKDRHIIVTGPDHQYTSTSSNSGFDSRAEYLFAAKYLFERESGVSEVFSRGQNPQHWHVARRGLGPDVDGEAYMEVSRKEASLTDVDNVLSGVVRRFTE